MLLKTERLILRELNQDDIHMIYELNNNPDVMRYISSNSSKPTIEECKEGIKRCIKYYKDNKGLGLYATVIQETGEVIGWTAIKDLDKTDEIEIGYRYLPKYWGRGYATEASKAVVDYGFYTLGLKKIVAVAQPENIASRRVLEKVGLKFIKNAYYYNANVVYYAIEI